MLSVEQFIFGTGGLGHLDWGFLMDTSPSEANSSSKLAEVPSSLRARFAELLPSWPPLRFWVPSMSLKLDLKAGFVAIIYCFWWYCWSSGWKAKKLKMAGTKRDLPLNSSHHADPIPDSARTDLCFFAFCPGFVPKKINHIPGIIWFYLYVK